MAVGDRTSNEAERSIETVLIVAEYSETPEIVRSVVRESAYGIEIAGSGADALKIAYRPDVFLVVADIALPDMSGIDLARALREDRGAAAGTHEIILSGSPTATEASDALVLNCEIIDKTALPRTLASKLDNRQLPFMNPEWADLGPDTNVHTHARSSAQRWASLVVRGCVSSHDLKTLQAWATVVAVSYSSLCESCRLVGIQPQDARDFVRALRALMLATTHRCDPELLLDFGDRRTLRAFMARAGSGFRVPFEVTAFIAEQHFVHPHNIAVQIAQRVLVNRGKGLQPVSARGARDSGESRSVDEW